MYFNIKTILISYEIGFYIVDSPVVFIHVQINNL